MFSPASARRPHGQFAPLPWTREERKNEYSDAARAKARRERLNKESNNVPLAIFYDVLYGAVPWLVGVAAVTSILFAIHEADADAQRIFPQLNAPVAIGTVSTFAAFLLVSKINANLACNRTVIAEFGNLTGALVNLAVWVRSQRNTKGWSVAPIRPLANDSTSPPTYYETTRLALVLASAPYIVKYNGRGVKVIPELLPLGQDQSLVDIFKKYITRSNSTERMSDFTAIVLMISEQIDDIQAPIKKGSEYSVLFAQLNAVTAAEASITGTAGYQPPYILDAMLYIVFVLFLLLMVIGDLIPSNRGNAVWLAGVVVLCTAVFFQISDRYWNPMALRSRKSGQAPLVSKACVATEVAIVEIFSKVPSQQLGDAAAAAAAAAPPPLRFRLGSFQGPSPR